MYKKEFEKTADVLLRTKLFCCADKDEINLICEKYSTIKTYLKNELIFSKDSIEKQIGIIIDGKASVRKENVVIGTLEKYSVFGAVTLYNANDKFVNNIVALNNCRVIFVSEEGVDILIENNSEFAKNYIKYLSERIYYLNEKIDSYTSPSAKDKVMLYFENQSTDGVCRLKGKMTDLSKELNLSRASLYRVIDELTLEGKIKKDGDFIKLL